MSIALFKGTEKGFRKSQRWWYNGWEVGRKDRRQTDTKHTHKPTNQESQASRDQLGGSAHAGGKGDLI